MSYQDPHSESLRTLLKSFAGIAVVLVCGTLGYHIIEGWSFMDSLYMTVITLTTIGFSEVRPLSHQGRIFTIVLIFAGFGMVGYSAITGAKFFVEGQIREILARRRFMKAIHRMRYHFIVCGFGRMGSFICHEFHARGIPFVVVEVEPLIQERVLEIGYLLSPGDATKEAALREAGVDRAYGLVSVLESDAKNLYTVLTARQLNPNLQIIARAGEEDAEQKLSCVGANRVINPYRIGGTRMVMGVVKPDVLDFLDVLMDYRALNIELEQVEVAEGSPYCGKTILESSIRKTLGLIVISIKKKGNSMVFAPGPDHLVEAGDTLITMGDKERLAVFHKAARAE